MAKRQLAMIRYLLSPFALVYGIVVKVRNLLFDVGIIGSTPIDRPSICVGNLTVGGTGKTPHVEYLVRLLAPNSKLAILSRGYKRKTQGFRFVNTDSTAFEVGDESFQIKSKFPKVTVAVDGNRRRGAKILIDENPDIDVILLDDAFQHRYVKPGLSILLVDYNNLITRDYFLPMGKLRDSVKELRRADCIVVTKCPPGISNDECQAITCELKPKPHQKVSFSYINYGKPISIFSSFDSPSAIDSNTKTIAFAGIANPKVFFNHLKGMVNVVTTISFPDHFCYTEKKIKTIFEKFLGVAGSNKAIVTTEKDAARIRAIESLDDTIKGALYYLPIEVCFTNNSSEEFNQIIYSYVRKSERNQSLHTK